MFKQKKTSANAWVFINVYLPFVPYIIEVIIRMGVIEIKLSWGALLDIFSGSTLAISCGFLGLLIYKSLVNEEPKLRSEDEREEMTKYAILAIIFAIISFAIFGIIMFCDLYSSYHNDTKIQEAGTFFKQILLLPALGLVVTSHYIPRIFNLKDRL